MSLAWNEPNARRSVFESYARENGFDPLLAEGWYKQSGDKIAAIKVNSSLLYLSLLFFCTFIIFS